MLMPFDLGEGTLGSPSCRHASCRIDAVGRECTCSKMRYEIHTYILTVYTVGSCYMGYQEREWKL
jgi:hypothetical protein